MSQKKAPPRPMGIYYIEGDEFAFETALRVITDTGMLETAVDASPYIIKQTTRGKDIKALQVPMKVIRGLRAWNRRRKESEAIIFTVYQLMSNNLLRPLNEKTLKDEAPVKAVRKMIKNLPKRSATAARR